MDDVLPAWRLPPAVILCVMVTLDFVWKVGLVVSADALAQPQTDKVCHTRLHRDVYFNAAATCCSTYAAGCTLSISPNHKLKHARNAD